MGHITKELPWCVIDIDTTTGQVFLQERWAYTWLIGSGQPAWTEAEKTSFHNAADKAIWNAWSNRVKLTVTGASSFARNMSGSQLPINLDIRRVVTNNHWSVRVTKIASTSFARSSVIWSSRIITLDTNDTAVRVVNSTRPKNRQTPVAHEFGHAAGNTSVLGRGDEYPATSTHRTDFTSIMNQGSQLRKRHFNTIVLELNKMIPDTIFAVGKIS